MPVQHDAIHRSGPASRRDSALAAEAPRSRRRSFLAGAIAGIMLLLLGGCAEWDRYWGEDNVTGPPRDRDLLPPTVVLQSPSGPDSVNATPISGDDYEIVVQAADNDTVQVVQIFIDDLAPQSLSAPPWKLRWDTTPLEEASRHRVWATATDPSGNVGTSAVGHAQVFNAGPRLVLVEPSDSSLVRGTIRITAEFTGDVPEIEKVEFLAGVWLSLTVTSPPWTVDLDTELLPAGIHYLAAKATTVLGSVGVSRPVRIHVNNGKPTVAIRFPTSGHRVATRGTLVLQADASDAEEGTLRGEQVAWRSDLQGQIGTGLELRRANLLPGDHVIRAVATNSWGAADSVAIDIEVLAQPTYTYCDDIQLQLLDQCFCTFCHYPGSSEYPSSELDLRTYASFMAGGKSTAQGLYECVYPCRPESSLVYNKITATVPWIGNPMPPPPIFPPVWPNVREMLRVWILEGAPPDEPEDCP